jgi:hypothetical protein
MSHATTGQFEGLRNGFVRHCGPTAITNIITTINKRYHYLVHPTDQKAKKEPVGFFPSQTDVFEEVSGIGIRSRIYWNMDFLKLFGGTYDMLTGLYLKACFRHYGIPYFTKRPGGRVVKWRPRNRWQAAKPAVRIRSRVPFRKEQYMDSLRRGCLLYLQLHHHPCYGNHHLVCYGYVEVESTASGSAGNGQRYRKTYLTVADGWTHELRYLDMAELGLVRYYEIGVQESRR